MIEIWNTLILTILLSELLNRNGVKHYNAIKTSSSTQITMNTMVAIMLGIITLLLNLSSWLLSSTNINLILLSLSCLKVFIGASMYLTCLFMSFLIPITYGYIYRQTRQQAISRKLNLGLFLTACIMFLNLKIIFPIDDNLMGHQGAIQGGIIYISFLTGLFIDCRLRFGKSISLNLFFKQVAMSLSLFVPAFPLIAIVISVGWMICLVLLNLLHLPEHLLNLPIYYSQFYGPFVFVYYDVKKEILKLQTQVVKAAKASLPF